MLRLEEWPHRLEGDDLDIVIVVIWVGDGGMGEGMWERLDILGY